MSEEKGTILFIVTSARKMGKNKTGIWFEEMSAPYYIFTDKGYSVEIASPKGGKSPFDPTSMLDENLKASAKRFQADSFAMNKIKHTKQLSEVDLNEYAAIFFPGGHGVMADLPEDETLKQKLGEYFETGRPVGAVCHGPGALVSAIKADGSPIVKGLQVSCFTNAEETFIGADKQVPFLLETRLRELGGMFSSGENFQPHAVRDGNLITGQNPASSDRCAELMLQALEENRPAEDSSLD